MPLLNYKMENEKTNNLNKDLINGAVNPAYAFRRHLKLKLIILGGVFLVTITALFLISSSIKKQVDRIQILRSENKYLLQSLDAVARLRTDHIRVQNFLRDLNSALVTSLEVPSKVVPVIESSITRRNLLKNKLELSNEISASDSNLGSIDFFLQVEGAPADIIGFLGDLEVGKIMLKLVSFEISSRPDVNRSILNLKGLIYTQK